jgi:hypothetical protein
MYLLPTILLFIFSFTKYPTLNILFLFPILKNTFLASSTLNDMFTHFEQQQYLDFYTNQTICHFTARSV